MDRVLVVDDVAGTPRVVGRGSRVSFSTQKESSSLYCIVRIVLLLSPTYIFTFNMSVYGWRLDAGMESSQGFGTWITILRLVLSFLIENTTMQFSSYCQH